MQQDEWYLEVTDADIRAARDAWSAARYGDAPADRVQLLKDDLERLWRVQARQVTRDFWADRGPSAPSTSGNGGGDTHSR